MIRGRARLCRNSRQSFIVGASWAHDPAWPGPHLVHVYLGPWLLTVHVGGRGA